MYKEVENRLYRYKQDKATLANLKIELGEAGDVGLRAIEYSDEPKGTGISKPTENMAIGSIDKKSAIVEQMKEVELNLRTIDNSLEALTEEERRIIESRYFEEKQWWQISMDIKYSEAWCKKVRRKAINKIMEILRGSTRIVSE